jgi:class 3 adenylate cyclase
VLRVGATELWGAEVNAASKLGEDIAKSGEILVTGAVRELRKACKSRSKIWAPRLPARRAASA